MLNIAVLVSGGGTNLQAIIDAIESGKITNGKVAIVVASNSEAYALERAKKHNIKSAVLSPKDFETKSNYDTALIKLIQDNNIDLIVLAGFMIILSSEFVRCFDKKIINIHPSLIPSFCGDGFYGLRVHKAVLEKGVKVTGATVHYVNEITDGGEIILQKAVYVQDDDTPETLQKRVMQEAEWDILPKAINMICNKQHLQE